MIIVLRAAQRIGGQALIWLDNDKEKEIKVDNIRNQISSFHSCTSRSSHGTPLAALAYLRSVIGSLLSADSCRPT